MDPESVAAQQGARRDAHRGAVRVVGGQRIGDLARPLPTRYARSDVAGGRPRSGAHVPGVRGVQITGGLQMFGDQRSVLVGRRRVTFFDRGRQPPVHLGSIGLELCLVGHRANQRVVEHILGLSGEPDLINELGRQQIGDDRFDRPAPSVGRGRTASRSPPLRSRCAWPAGRDGRCARRWWPAAWQARSPQQPLPPTCMRPRCPRSTPRSASSRTISSAKNGLPAALSAIVSAQPADRRVRPEQLGDQCCGLRITQRRKGYRLRTVHPRQRTVDTRGGR